MAQPQRRTDKTEGAPSDETMSMQEFLRWQADQELLYEFIDGRPVLLPKMMTGASSSHDRITVNALGSLFGQLRGGPCRPSTADMAVRIESAGRVRRPDLLVDCGAPKPKDTAAADPRLVLEVLSPSTHHVDLAQKLEEYKSLPGQRLILLAEQDIARVALYRRDDKENWRLELTDGLQAALDLPEINCALSMADLYEGVKLTEQEKTAPKTDPDARS